MRKLASHELTKQLNRGAPPAQAGLSGALPGGQPGGDGRRLSRGEWFEHVRQYSKTRLERVGLEVQEVESADGAKVFFRLFAANPALEAEAEALNFKLKLRPEVDPGIGFWHEQNAGRNVSPASEDAPDFLH